MVNKVKSFSIVTRKLLILKQPVISVMSEINTPLSPINLFFTQAVSCEENNVGKTVFNLMEMALEKIFVSKFHKEFSF